MSSKLITVARGDGIGPEIMDATLMVLREAGAPLEVEEITIGKSVYDAGHPSGIAPEAWESLRRSKVFLKAPIMTPQGGGFKSLNVTVRKTLGLFANVRPCRSYHPIIPSRFPDMDLVIVRENEEDLYAGIEYRSSSDTYYSVKAVTAPGCERIVRYAFEYARAHGRRRVTCMTKDNIMKFTDGLFHRTFDQVAAEFPEIANDHYIIDIGAARLATAPERFDVVVTLNLYGDILSDIVAEISGSVGLAGSANVGSEFAMFEAVHGTAPDIAGKDIANPSGLLHGAVLMLQHLGLAEEAARVQNALLVTLEEGVHTGDVFRNGLSRIRVGTQEFARAVVRNLGRRPQQLAPLEPRTEHALRPIALTRRAEAQKQVVGIDIEIEARPERAEQLAQRITEAVGELATLERITNRGVTMWPHAEVTAALSDQWSCRLRSASGDAIGCHECALRLAQAGLAVAGTMLLHDYDGVAGYSA